MQRALSSNAAASADTKCVIINACIGLFGGSRYFHFLASSVYIPLLEVSIDAAVDGIDHLATLAAGISGAVGSRTGAPHGQELQLAATSSFASSVPRAIIPCTNY